MEVNILEFIIAKSNVFCYFLRVMTLVFLKSLFSANNILCCLIRVKTMALAINYIQNLQAEGRYNFTTDEAVCALGTTLVAARAALRRLKSKKMIADPYRGFHVVVPPEYRSLGCLPADQFIPDLMDHLGEPYYVGLLSAASYHGAAHQRPQVFQVIVPKARRGFACGNVNVEFVARRDMTFTTTIERNTPMGILRISSPEATALELVGYSERSGYLNNVATVLTELADSMDGELLLEEARRGPLAWVQRLGYLLCLVEAKELAVYLEPLLTERKAYYVGLAPRQSTTGFSRDARWRLVVNIDVEPDL